MAITAGAAGAWAASNATTQTVTLPTHSAGQLLILVAACKPYTADPTVGTAGWTRLFSYADGTTVAGSGTGSVRQCVFYKEATSSAETNPVVTWGTTSAPGIAVALSFSKGGSETWSVPAYVNGNCTGTNISVAMASNPGIVAGDWGLSIHTTRDDSALTVPSWTATGTTLGTATVFPTTPIASATSNQMAGTIGYRSVTSGTASANPTVTATQAATETGVSTFLRLRASTPAAVTITPRARNDDGSETTATWKAAQATDVTVPEGEVFRLRWLVQETAGVAVSGLDADFMLEFRVNAGGWLLVGADTANWIQPGGSALVTDTAATTQQMSGGTGSFVGGQIENGNARLQSAVPASGNTEYEYVMSLIPADVVNGDFIDIRLSQLRNDYGGPANRITVTSPPIRITVGTAGPPMQPLTVPLLDGAPALYAPTVLPQPVSISLGFIDGAAALYAPTVRQAQFVTLGLLDAAGGLYSPTVLPQPVNLIVPLLTSIAQLYAPGVIPAQFVTLGLLTSASAVYSPTVVPNQLIDVGFIDAGAALFEPVVAAAPLSVTLPLLDTIPDLYAPAVLANQAVALGLLDSQPNLYAPGVLPAQSLTVPFLDAAAVVYAPVVKQAQFVTLGLIDGVAAVYAPVVTPQPVTVSLALLTSTSALYPPSAIPAQFVTLAFLNEATLLHAPTVVSATAPYVAAVLADAPLGYWRAGEASGSVLDLIGSNVGTVAGTVTRDVAGALASGDDGAILLDGTSGKIEFGDVLDITVGSYECWIKRSNTTGALQVLMSKGVGQPNIYLNTDNLVYIGEENVWWGTSSIALADTNWHHIVVTSTGTASVGAARLYIDGIDRTVNQAGGALVANSQVLRVGGGASIGFFAGAVDEVALYGTVLSPTRVLAHYDAAIGTTGTKNITLPLLTSSAALYAPTVVGGTTSTGYPPDQLLTNPSLPTIPSVPALGVATLQAAWPAIRYTRVSNVSGQRHVYSRAAVWNSDQSMILLGVGTAAVFSGSAPYAKLHDLPFLVGMHQWSNVLPNKIWGTWIDENYLRSQTYNGGSSWTLNVEHVFTGYTAVSLGDNEGGLSDDDRYCVLQATNGSGQNIAFVFDTLNKVIVGGSGNVLNTGAARPDTCFIDRSGQYMLVYWSGSGGGGGDGPGLNQGMWQYDRTNLATPIRQLTQAARHCDPGRLADGTPVLVQCDYGGEVYRLDNGARTFLFQSTVAPTFPHLTGLQRGHISCRNTDRDGWGYFSVYDTVTTFTGSTFGRDQIVAVKLDGSGTVEVFGWSYHRLNGDAGAAEYWTSPMASPSRDGRFVLWASAHGDTTDPYTVYAYVSEAIPTVVQSVSLGLLDSGPTLYAPAVLPQPRTLTIPLLTITSAVYPPTLVAAPIGVTLPQLVSAPTLFEPIMSGTSAATLPLLTSASALYAPTVAHAQLLTVPLLQSLASLYNLSVLPGPATLSLSLLDSGAAVYSPQLSAINPLTLPLLSSVAVLYPPTTDRNIYVYTPLLSAIPDLYAPVVSFFDTGEADRLAYNTTKEEFWPTKNRARFVKPL